MRFPSFDQVFKSLSQNAPRENLSILPETTRYQIIQEGNNTLSERSDEIIKLIRRASELHTEKAGFHMFMMRTLMVQ